MSAMRSWTGSKTDSASERWLLKLSLGLATPVLLPRLLEREWLCLELLGETTVK